MKRYYCDVCGKEISDIQALGGQYFKARIHSPLEVEIDITAYRPIPTNSESHPPLEICVSCVLTAIAALEKQP